MDTDATHASRSSSARGGLKSKARLSPLDSIFLHLEDARIPMHMASIAIFEGEPLRDTEGRLRLGELQSLISGRLSLVPKLRQRPHRGVLPGAPLVWIDDPTFDVANHVIVRSLPQPGSEWQLLELCDELLERPLARDKPLWELSFVEGLENGRIALIEKLHHSMADGIAAAELATVLLDLSPEIRAHDERSPWRVEDPPPTALGAASDLFRLTEIPLRCLAWGGWTVMHPVRRSRAWVEKGGAMASVLRAGLKAPRSGLNAPTGPQRELHVIRLNLNEIGDIAHANDATVNDVVLTLVCHGLHWLMAEHEPLDANAEVQALVPVGFDAGPARGLGNRVSALFVRLPVGTNDPASNLARIAATSKAHKSEHQELVGDSMLRLLEPAPQSVLSGLAKLMRYQPFFNLIVTNVPGPSIPLYALGARMIEAFPVVPLVGNQGIGVAALSYLDQINLGVLSDPAICSRIEPFCQGVQAAFTELRGAETHDATREPAATNTPNHAVPPRTRLE